MQLSCIIIFHMQQTADRILEKLSEDGFRITKLRRAMAFLLAENALPLSAEEIIARLAEKGAAVNKTTVYRELSFLKERKIAVEVQFMHERGKRYELASDEHHHHLICLRCRKVEDIVLKDDLVKQERKIMRSRGFKVLNHSLEFLGICNTCR